MTPERLEEMDELLDSIDSITQFFAGVSRYRVLTGREEVELAKRIEHGDLDAKDKLITHNLKLVISVAKHYQVSTDMALLDLVQEGTIGLIRAAEKFDWRRGFKFSTYATPWIRQAIQRGLANKGRAIRLPPAVEQVQRKIAAAERRLSDELDREPTPDEIAAATGLDCARVIEMMRTARVVASLDRPIGDGDETTLGAMLSADTPDIGEQLEATYEREQVRRAVAVIAEPERSVIRRRYGLDGDTEPQSYAAIARALQLDTYRVRRLEALALKRLAQRPELVGVRAA